MVRCGSLLGGRCCYMLYGGVLKEGGQIPKYRIPVFPVFRYRYNADTEPVFLRVSVSHTDTGFPVFSVRLGIGIHHCVPGIF